MRMDVESTVCVCVRAHGVPAAQRGLKEGCDPHTKENGPYELACGPLVKADTHCFGEEEWHCYSSTETCQIVLRTQHGHLVRHGT